MAYTYLHRASETLDKLTNRTAQQLESTYSLLLKRKRMKSALYELQLHQAEVDFTLLEQEVQARRYALPPHFLLDTLEYMRRLS